MTILINKNSSANLAVIKVMLLLLLICFVQCSWAVVEFNFSADQKIEAVIASGELNRIGLNNGEIMEVIGDENKYAVYWSGDWRNLFIKPKVAVGESIELSLIFVGGQVQDFRFTVGDLVGQTILINNVVPMISANNNWHYRQHQLANQQLKSAIGLMIKAMLEGEKGKYYVIDNKRILLKNQQKSIIQEKAYYYKDLRGGVLLVKNLTSKPLNIIEEDFDNLFQDTLAINLSSTIIKPQATAKLLIISRATND